MTTAATGLTLLAETASQSVNYAINMIQQLDTVLPAATTQF